MRRARSNLRSRNWRGRPTDPRSHSAHAFLDTNNEEILESRFCAPKGFDHLNLQSVVGEVVRQYSRKNLLISLVSGQISRTDMGSS